MCRYFFTGLLGLLLNAAAAAETVISCNEGDMTVEQVGDNNYQAKVVDPGVVAYFFGLQGQIVEGRQHGYPSNPFVARRLPYMTKFMVENDRDVFVVSELRGSEWNFYSQQYGPSLRWYGEGITLFIGNTHWNGSHSYISYEYANWYFERCRWLDR